jgi:hypothetical protein
MMVLAVMLDYRLCSCAFPIYLHTSTSDLHVQPDALIRSLCSGWPVIVILFYISVRPVIDLSASVILCKGNTFSDALNEILFAQSVRYLTATATILTGL